MEAFSAAAISGAKGTYSRAGVNRSSRTYVEVPLGGSLRPVGAAPLGDPCPELVLAQDPQHVLAPLLALLWNFLHVWEVVMQCSSLLDEADKVRNIEALDLGAVCLFDCIVLHIFLLARHYVIHQVTILVIMILTYPEQSS